MASFGDFHSQLASIMEVLANAAVAEICQLVDDGFATLRLEISRSQRENVVLRSRLRLLEVRAGEREPTPPLHVLTCSTTDHHFGEDGSAINKRNIKSTILENTDTQQSQLVVVAEPPAEPEVVVIKKERLEEELRDCSVLGDHQTAPSISSTHSVGPQCVSLAAESVRPMSVEAELPRVSVLARYENQDFVRPKALQQEEKGGLEEARAQGQDCHPADKRGPDPNRGREMTKLTKELNKHVVDSLSADEDTSLIKTPELSPPNTGVKGVCGAAADWRGDAVLPAVKLEAEASWSEALCTFNTLVSVPRGECVSNSRLTNTSGQHTESEAAELDAGSLDSSSFDDLFSSPEVARSLTAPHKHSADAVAGTEEPLSSFLCSESSFGNSSMSNSLTAFSNASSDSRSRSFPSSTGRAFSCQQCGRPFSSSRDLLVHQRSHSGERIYHCHLCKKPFVHPHQLKTHQRVHTGEKPFSCSQCGKRFSQSSHIKRHMSVHTGEKRYSCSLCGKRFSQACSLKVHQTVHTGERPYSCTKCGKNFSVLGNLVRHQSVHNAK